MSERSVRPTGHDAGRFSSAGPWAQGQDAPRLGPGAGGADFLPVEDGTLCRALAPRPGPSRALSRPAESGAGDRLAEAMRRAVPLLPAEIRGEFQALLSPANLAITTGVLAAWAGSHAFGVGEVADVLLLVAGGLFLGAAAFDAGSELALFVKVGAGARTEAELDASARHLARFVSIVGSATFTAMIMKAGGKSAPRRLSGVAQAEGAAGRPVGGGPFWKAYDFGPDYPGTSVPQHFTLEVAGREFRIKGTLNRAGQPSGGTKHMYEYAAKYGTTGARAGQVDFPLSPLAGALEQVVRSGDLGPLLRGQVTRLGTREAPYMKGPWELSFELVNGRVEVLHAEFKGR